MAEADLAALPPRGQLQLGEGVYRHRVGRNAANVAEQESGAALGHERAHAVAQPGEVVACDRARNGEADGLRR